MDRPLIDLDAMLANLQALKAHERGGPMPPHMARVTEILEGRARERYEARPMSDTTVVEE
jgi:hypothetical protein